jgi:hypothetical protein
MVAVLMNTERDRMPGRDKAILALYVVAGLLALVLLGPERHHPECSAVSQMYGGCVSTIPGR